MNSTKPLGKWPGGHPLCTHTAPEHLALLQLTQSDFVLQNLALLQTVMNVRIT